MKLQVNLDDKWINDYEETIAQLISYEINAAVKAEVKKIVTAFVKVQLDSVRKEIESQIKKTTPAKLAKLLETLNQ